MHSFLSHVSSWTSFLFYQTRCKELTVYLHSYYIFYNSLIRCFIITFSVSSCLFQHTWKVLFRITVCCFFWFLLDWFKSIASGCRVCLKDKPDKKTLIKQKTVLIPFYKTNLGCYFAKYETVHLSTLFAPLIFTVLLNNVVSEEQVILSGYEYTGVF